MSAVSPHDLRPQRRFCRARVVDQSVFRKSLDDFVRERRETERASDVRHRDVVRQSDRAAHEVLLTTLSDVWWRDAARGVTPSFPAPWTLSTPTLQAIKARLSGKATKQPRKRKYVKTVRS